jgi:hypothetical protein
MIFDELRFDCTGCPCLNNDYEQGASCNLEYDCSSRWSQNGELYDTSENCKLVSVNFEGGNFLRSEKKKYTKIHPMSWNKF